ncbi:MAG: molybdopterin-synthase adenylyltransferase MoeB [Bacteroidota bacterium]|jgi:molybdopterin/thiamine biosynthesis adenylyltransferase/rhodanese-related sulfurtransferase
MSIYNRYNRQVILPAIGESGQDLLLQAKILVVGAGGLGCPVLQYLAAAGVGTLGIIDHDVIEISNLQRQILFKEAQIGESKAVKAKEAITAQNPHIEVHAYQALLSPSNAQQLIGLYDIIIDGTDNFATRYLINDVCVSLQKPFIAASILQFEGQISVYNYQEGPTYRCLFPEPPQDALTCAEAGVLGVVGGIMGSLQANEAIKMITGIGEVLSGKLFIINMLTLHNYCLTFERSSHWHKIDPNSYAALCETNSKTIEITAIDLKENIADYTIIDIRKPAEFKRFAIGGINSSVENLWLHHATMLSKKPVVICCASGNSSLTTVKALIEKHGYANIFSLKGGINAYMYL